MTTIEIAQEVIRSGAQLFRPRKDETGQYDVKPYFSGNKRGWVAMDSFSAGAIMAVYNGLNDQNKATFAALDPIKAAKVAFKLLK